MLRRVWAFRDLVLSLVRRQFQIRYRQSAAGFLWALVPPLLTVGAATVVFQGVAGIEAPGPAPYAVFAFAAVVPWTFFASSITLGVSSVSSNIVMVTRLPFPRAALPLSAIGLALVDLTLAGVTFVIFAYATGNGLPLTALWFPVLLLVEIALAVGVVMLGSALNVFARDIRLAVPLVVQFWLLLTPVMYPLEELKATCSPCALANPMTGIIESFRGILVNGQAPDLGLLAPSLIGAVVLLVVGLWYFAATEPRFADVI